MNRFQECNNSIKCVVVVQRNVFHYTKQSIFLNSLVTVNYVAVLSYKYFETKKVSTDLYVTFTIDFHFRNNYALLKYVKMDSI